MRLLLFIICLSLPAITLSAEEKSDINSFIMKNTVQSDMINFGYLIQPYGLGYNEFSKSSIYCIDVKNKMMVSAEPHIFIKKDELKGERQADVRIIFNEKIIPAGQTRRICLQLTPPKERLNDGVYNTFGAILLNKSKALGFRIRYEVISAVQDVAENLPADKGSKLNIPQLVVDDKTPLAGFVVDFMKLANSRYSFDKNFLNIFEVDSRSTCNFKNGAQYEISQDNNINQCYFLFKRKAKGESSITISNDTVTQTPAPIKAKNVKIKVIAR